MADLQTIMKSIQISNQQDRERFHKLSSRTVGAIISGEPDELSSIVRDATGYSSEGIKGGAESLEAGVTDGAVRDSGNAETPTGN